MSESLPKTGERVIPGNFSSREEFLVYLEHLFVYELARDEFLKEDAIVLEVGCGAGYGAGLLSAKVRKIIALDVDRSAIAYASGNYASENCLFQLYDGKKIPFEDNRFDAVISFQVIEHIKDDRNYVIEIHRVLKEGGFFLLTTPNRTHRLKPGQKPWNRFHVREYYPSELEKLLKAEFSRVEIRGIGGCEEVQQIEMARVRQSQSIDALDPLRLRNLIPEPLKPFVIKILRKLIRRKSKGANAEDFLPRYSVKDFHLIQDNVAESLDLLAISTK